MRITPSSLLALTTLISASLFFNGAQSASFSLTNIDAASPVSGEIGITSAQLTMDGRKIEKRRDIVELKSNIIKSILTVKKKQMTAKNNTKKTQTNTKQTVKKKASSSPGQFSGDGTFYDTTGGSPGHGLGSCGEVHENSELVAALNAPQMKNGGNPNNNPNCGKFINVFAGGKSVRVKIVDTCPPCVKGDVDLSITAFKMIGDPIQGRIPISWSWA